MLPTCPADGRWQLLPSRPPPAHTPSVPAPAPREPRAPPTRSVSRRSPLALHDCHHPQFPSVQHSWAKGAGQDPHLGAAGKAGSARPTRTLVAWPAALCSWERGLDGTRGRPAWPGGTAPHPVGGAGNSHTWPLIPFPPHLVNVAPGGRRVWCLRHEDLAGAWPACPPRAHPADRRVGRTDQSRQVCQVCQRQLLTSKCLALRHRHSEDPEPPATLSSPWSRCGPVSRRLPRSENPPLV